MKKFVCVLGLVLTASLAFGDSVTFTSGNNTTSTTTEVSAVLPVSGYLDKIVMYNSIAGATSAVVVADYSADGIAVETYATASAVADTTATVIRPRVLGTSTAGAALTYSILSSGVQSTNILTQQIQVPYERMIIGGNVKVSLIATVVPSNKTNVVTTIVFFEPLKK